MKVVFLDIDGVLNSLRTCMAFGGYPFTTGPAQRYMFDEVAIRLIRGIVELAGAKIVLSSSWRIHADWKQIGPDLQLPIIDRTPSLSGIRGEEIAAWLEDHPEVEQYAIIDDDSDMLPEQMEYFVHTQHNDGFSWDDASLLARLLGVDVFDINRPAPEPWAR